MKKFDVQIALEGIREAKAEWAKAVRAFNADVEKVLVRLLHEASVNYMSPEEVARFSGLSTKRVRSLMCEHGLNPRDGKRMLADSAAKALADNAALLGIRPHDMDLMSPLAYLPMGSQLRQELTDKAVARVTELPEDTVTVSRNTLSLMLTDCYEDGYSARSRENDYEPADSVRKTLDHFLSGDGTGE